MISVGQILLLAAAVMASVPAVQGPDGLGRVTLFVCAHCTSTGKLSSHSLFLNRAAVCRHIAAAMRHKTASDSMIRQNQMKARSGDIMAGSGGAVGSAPDVRHQPEGDVLPQTSRVNLAYISSIHISYDTLLCISASGVVVRAALQYA
jgi:hypothetical protein